MVSPTVMVSIVSESGSGADGVGVVIADRAAVLGDDQSTTSVGVSLMELTLCAFRMTGSAEVLVRGSLPRAMLTICGCGQW